MKSIMELIRLIYCKPLDTAFSVMKYADNTSAAVAYKGSDFRTFVMAFPFECIKNKEYVIE